MATFGAVFGQAGCEIDDHFSMSRPRDGSITEKVVAMGRSPVRWSVGRADLERD